MTKWIQLLENYLQISVRKKSGLRNERTIVDRKLVNMDTKERKGDTETKMQDKKEKN